MLDTWVAPEGTTTLGLTSWREGGSGPVGLITLADNTDPRGMVRRGRPVEPAVDGAGASGLVR